LGAGKFDIALIIVSYAVCSGLCGPYWGKLSDRIGRKPVIMICLAGGALAYVLLGLASELWMVFAARAFAGLMAGNIGVASAMMADLTTPENRARGMGLIGAAFGLGLAMGPVLGGLLAGDGNSFTLPCIVAGGMSVLAIIAAALFLPESVSKQRQAESRALQQDKQGLSIYQMLKQTGNRLLTCQYVLHNSCVSAFSYMFPLWVADLLDWTPREVGIIFGIQGIIMAVMQGGFMGQLIRLLGEFPLLRVSISLFLCGLLTAAFAETMPVMVTAAFMAMSGATLCMPVLNTLTSNRTPIALRGRMLGTTSSAGSWGRVIGPLFAGTNLALFGYQAAWLGCAALVVFYLSWALWEKPDRHIGMQSLD
jgi:MFS family permease